MNNRVINSSENEQALKGGVVRSSLLNDVRDSLIVLKDISSKVGNSGMSYHKLNEYTATATKSIARTNNENLLIDTLSCVSLQRTDDVNKVPNITKDLTTSLHGPYRGRSKFFTSQFPLSDDKENTYNMV